MPDTANVSVLLERRGILAIAGPDRKSFLQGLVTNDVMRVSEDRAVYAAFLTPQGKYLHDFLIAELGESLLLDCEAERRDDLLRRLRPYRLRAKVDLTDRTDELAVAALLGSGAPAACGLPAEKGMAIRFAEGLAFVDPRRADLGVRLIAPRAGLMDAIEKAGFAPGTETDYDRLRLAHGIPDGSRDLLVEKAILLENNIDALHGISWDKGCYIGQELTARTRYRGLVKKRLFPVDVEGPLPPPGTPVMLGDAEAGEMRSGLAGRALALLRLEAVDRCIAEGIPLTAAEARLRPDTDALPGA